jgi:quercetin dioxygenase-like cupin family protein
MSEHMWFLNTLVSVRVPHDGASDGISVLESRAPQGDSPPMHVHQEDEIFHVLEGTMLIRVAGEDHLLQEDETFLAPKGKPHSYRVESDVARWLVVTPRGDFERFVRSFSREAPRAELPEPAGPPTPTEARALAEACSKHGIELVGPPLSS